MKTIVVVGSLNVDLVSTLDRMPVEGETIAGTGFQIHSGGKGANQAVAIGRLGAPVEMVGALGDDAFAETLAADLRSAGVGTAGVKRVAGSSGCAIILVAKSGSNCIVVNAGANAELRPDDLHQHASLFRDASVVLCQLETPIETVMEAAVLARAASVPFVLDPAPMTAEALPAELLKLVTWLTPNETETAALLSQMGQPGHDLGSDPGVERAAEQLLSMGPRNVILKRGSRGVYLAGADCTPAHIAAEPVTAVDTTAAGDAFNGGFAFALAQGKTPAEAAAFACSVAAFSVTRCGAQESMPLMADLA